LVVHLQGEVWLVSAVLPMYIGAKTVVRTVYGNSSGFEVKVGMDQGSALSPLLFVIVMEAISREFRVALPWELLYADTSVDIGASANLEVMDKFCYLIPSSYVECGWRIGDADADAAVEARIRFGWNKFRQLVSLIRRGRLYSSCVRSSMLDGSETWPVRKENEVALQSRDENGQMDV